MGTKIPLGQGYQYQEPLEVRLNKSTAEIGLSVRTTNCLEERGIFTVGDLLNTTREELLRIQNFGDKTLAEVYAALEKFGFVREDEDASVPLVAPAGVRGESRGTARRRPEPK